MNILYITAQQLQVDGHLFQHDEHAQFAHWLLQHPNETIMLVDVVEEDFRLETLPHVTGRGQQAIWQRKFVEYYPDTPFRQAHVVQQRSPSQDDILFSALTQPAPILPWLEILQQQRIPLLGIYSLPHLCSNLLNQFPSTNLLLVSWQQHAGLRQSYFVQQQLHISRLIPCKHFAAEQVIQELFRTCHYLRSQHELPTQLDVHFLVTPEQQQQLLPLLSEQLGMRCHWLMLDTPDATPWFIQQLQQHRPVGNYANREHRREFSMQRQLRWVQYASFIALNACLGLAGYWLWQANVLQQQAHQLEQHNQQLAQTLHTLPSQTDNNRYQSAAEIWQQLQQTQRAPEAILQPISVVLDEFPALSLQQLEWHSQTDALTIQLQLSLNAQNNTHRDTLDYLSRFEQALHRQNYQVEFAPHPLDVSSNSTLSNLTQLTSPFIVKLKQGKTI